MVSIDRSYMRAHFIRLRYIGHGRLEARASSRHWQCDHSQGTAHIHIRGVPLFTPFSTQPSEVTPLTALKIAEFVTEAGFPPGAFNVVNGYGKAVPSP